MRKQITEYDIPESDLEAQQVETFLSDAAQDLEDYALGRVSLEQLGDRLRWHKAQAETWAVTQVVDIRNQNDGGDDDSGPEAA